MLPYQHVKSIHDQKMARFVAERDRQQAKALAEAGKESALQRRVREIVESLRDFGEGLSRQGRFA